MVEFAWPAALGLVVAPLLVRWFLPVAERSERALFVPNVTEFRFAGASSGLAGRSRRWLILMVMFLSWILLVAAIARPQYVGQPTAIPTSGRDLMLAIDVSGSMGVEDMYDDAKRETRLDAVKRVAAEFIDRREGDRVGLIVFGTQPYLYVPLTFDRKTVGEMLDTLEHRIAGGRTTIGNTIGLAIHHLKERPDGDRVVVLLTDGAHNEGDLSPSQAASLASSFGVRIHTIGVGSSSTTFFSSLSLDEASLRHIAATTGGTYFRASDPDMLEDVYAEISRLEPVQQDPETFRPIQSLLHWPLGLAIAGFLTAIGLSMRNYA